MRSNTKNAPARIAAGRAPVLAPVLARALARAAFLVALPAPGCATRGPTLRATTAGPGWSYEVDAGPGARELVIVGEVAAGAAESFTIDEATAPFVRDVQVATADSWIAVDSRDSTWTVRGCAARGCKVRYRFLLAAAAAALNDAGEAQACGDALEAPPSSWLLHPSAPSSGVEFRVHVRVPAGLQFVTGLSPLRGRIDAYGGDVADLPSTPYSGFGPFRLTPIAGSNAFVAVAPATNGGGDVSDGAVVAWATNAARAVTTFYGRFPAARLPIFVNMRPGAGIDHGMTMGGGGTAIVIDVGVATPAAAFADDWELTHELVHTALPTQRRRYHWIEEGLATYVEPIARARAGIVSPEMVWHWMVKGMPNGQPALGDHGLDATPTWGRTYWGGAMFCLLADVEIRERTQNLRSLDDALRGILAAGGSLAVEWPLERVISVADEAVGVAVLRELHDRYGASPEPVDLERLWARLGVVPNGDTVTFDDAAPLAAVRRAITAPAPHP